MKKRKAINTLENNQMGKTGYLRASHKEPLNVEKEMSDHLKDYCQSICKSTARPLFSTIHRD